MSDKKHIDRLFQEKLKDFEAIPSDAIWESIESKLHDKKRKRRVIPIWWQMAGVAAVLVLLLTLANLVSNNAIENNSTENPVVGTDDKDNLNVPAIPSDSSTILNNFQDKNVVEETSERKYLNSNSNSIATQSQNSIATITNTKTNLEESETQNTGSLVNRGLNNTPNTNTLATNTKADEGVKSSNLPKLNQNTIENSQKYSETEVLIDVPKNDPKTAVTDIHRDENSDLIKDNSENNTQTLEEAITQANNTIEKEEGEKLSRWNISTNVAPVYFSSLGEGSSLDDQFIGNSKSSEINLSYGITGSYAINNKLKIRAGINKVNLGYNTNDVIISTGAGITSIEAFSRGNSNINFNAKNENTTVLSSQSMSFSSAPEIVSSNVKTSLNQEFGFIEVPIELEYSIINKKIGLNVIGGFSTLLLDNNKVYSTLNENRVLLGEAQNINSTSYSANFGLGLNYNVSEKIKFNLEPTFKYQINTFRDTSGDFIPYFIGFYTGLSYKF